eukprot:5163057-Prorocentrum_lima.AAC.1
MCIRDSLGGMQGPDPLPKLTPPADIVVQHLGGVPSGWHVRDIFLVHKGAPGFFHILLPNWCQVKELLQ